ALTSFAELVFRCAAYHRSHLNKARNARAVGWFLWCHKNCRRQEYPLQTPIRDRRGKSVRDSTDKTGRGGSVSDGKRAVAYASTPSLSRPYCFPPATGLR